MTGAAPGGLVMAWRLLPPLVLIATATAVSFSWIAKPGVVIGRSMEPTLHHGDRILVDVWSYRYRPPRPGEVVVFRGPGTGHRRPQMIKRCRRAPLHAPPSPIRGRWPELGGNPIGVWLQGDNPLNSRDSREFGPVPTTSIEGRVILRVWPPSRWGTVGRRR